MTPRGKQSGRSYLVIERKEGESVWVGPVRLTLTWTRKGRAKLGIEAPVDVLVVREELLP